MMQNENKTALFLDCSSGLSGDMFVGALLDLGADAQKLVQTLNTLPLDGFSIRISRVNKSALNVCDFDVILDGPEAGLDHNMDYLYGHEHDHAHAEHMHSHEEQGNEPGHSHTEHTHEHVHSHTEHTHENVHSHAEHTHENVHSHAEHVHRSLEDITRILKGGALSENALATALKVFTIVAQAEAHVHGKTVEEVHFHEVGAVDSIVDIAAAAICLDDLHIDRVVLTHLTDGTGTVRCQHGILPIPVPAVAQIAAAHGIPLHIAPIHGELVTPTGAALAAGIRTEDHLPDRFSIKKIGMGAGKRDYETAGFLRAMLIEAC